LGRLAQFINWSLVDQAIVEKASLVSQDAVLGQYGVRVI
jgi:hypothetical protein